MCFSRWMRVFIGVIIVVGIQIVSSNGSLQYKCSASSGVITITNPDPSTYIWVQVNASDRICNSSLVGDKIFVYDCYNQSLTMLLCDEIGLPMIITSVIKSYRLMCSAARRAEGVSGDGGNDTYIAQFFTTTAAPTPSPIIDINSTIIDPDTGLEGTMATIGQHFLWYAWSPEEYMILPEYCTTCTDPLHNLTVYSVDTHIDGCTYDDSLVSSFRYKNASKHLLVADLYAFRFPNSDQIYLQCTVRGCPEGSKACDLNCPSNTGRRKRKAKTTPKKVVTNTLVPSIQDLTGTTHILGPIKSTKEKRSRAGLRRGKFQVSLTVIGQPNVPIDDLFTAACLGFHGGDALLPTLLISLTVFLCHVW